MKKINSIYCALFAGLMLGGQPVPGFSADTITPSPVIGINELFMKAVQGYSPAVLNQLDERMGVETSNTARSNRTKLLMAKNAGGLSSMCSFPEEPTAQMREQFKSATALLVPVYKVRLGNIVNDATADNMDFGLDVDWPATLKLHEALSKGAKIRLLPISESRKYDAQLRRHLFTALLVHLEGLEKASGGDGGFLGMLSRLGKGNDANDANKQLAGPFNSEFYPSVLKQFDGAQYVISTSDTKIITAYFSTLLHAYAGGSGKFPAPTGEDLTSVRVGRSVVSSYIASYSYLLGTGSQKEAEDAAVGSGSRLVKLVGKGLVEQWRVLGPEYAMTSHLLDAHALARANHVGHMSVTPMDVYSSMTVLGFNAYKLQCAAFNKEMLSKAATAGETAMTIMDEIDKESNPFVGFVSRGDQGPQPGAEGRACVGWGCTRTVDLVRDKRYSTLRAAYQLLPGEKIVPNIININAALVDAFSATMNERGISGAIDSKKLK